MWIFDMFNPNACSLEWRKSLDVWTWEEYKENKEKLILDVADILKQEDSEYSDKSLSEDFNKQLITVLLYEVLMSNISKNLNALAQKYNPTKEQLEFSSSAINALTNETYFYESSRCW